MRILADLGHPAHAHLFGGLLARMAAEGHEVLATVRDKDVTVAIAQAKGIPCQVLGGRARGGRSLWGEWLARDRAVLAAARRFRPDLLLGNLNPAVAHASVLLRRPSVNFLDHEPHIVRFPVGNWITIPFTSTLVVPSAVRHDYGRKAVVVPSYKELAYLHPNHWRPDPQVQAWLDERVGPGGRFALFRFVSWTAHHDAADGGLATQDKLDLVREVSATMPVLISSEGPLPAELEPHRLPLPPEALHTVLHAASLFVGDSQTMATEAAVLGTPAVRCNHFVGARDMGNFIELERRYGLVRNRRNPRDALAEALAIAHDPSAKATAGAARKRLLSEKADLQRLLHWLLLDYPESARRAREDPQVLWRFVG